MEEGQTALILEGVACLRGDRLLFEELGLSLGAGEAALVTGPNGVGKSSLLRMIAGLLRPEAGRIDVRGKVALAAEQAALDEDQPLAKALAFWARLDSSDRVAHAMTAMAIDHLAQVPVRMLSTGQRKRAVLARTIASGADIWLLDEPGNGLDDAALGALGGAMAAHRAARGIIVAASHQPLPFAPSTSLAL